MKAVLEQFEQQISSIDGALEELLPPVTDAELTSAEQELGITFPEDIRSLYKWRNGQIGILFLFDEFRLYSLEEMLKMQRVNLNSCTPEYTDVTDDSGIFKDCIFNPKWIPIGDNGGNTMLYLDMDPGKKGVKGQLLEACDGEPNFIFKSLQEFLEATTKRIASGEIAWDETSGGFQQMDEVSVAERENFDNRLKLLESAPGREELRKLHEGETVVLVGAIKPNHKTKKHKLYIKDGLVRVTGDIGKINNGSVYGPPWVEVKVRIGKKALFGVGSPLYEVISCQRIPS